MVPGLRAPVATVAPPRTLSSLAPGRVTLAVGAGFTGRFTLGLGSVRLSRLAREIDDIRGLLAGEERIHPEGGRPVRDMPVPGAERAETVPLHVSCRGPKAQALARERGDGAMTGIIHPGGLAMLPTASPSSPCSRAATSHRSCGAGPQPSSPSVASLEIAWQFAVASREILSATA